MHPIGYAARSLDCKQKQRGIKIPWWCEHHPWTIRSPMCYYSLIWPIEELRRFDDWPTWRSIMQRVWTGSYMLSAYTKWTVLSGQLVWQRGESITDINWQYPCSGQLNGYIPGNVTCRTSGTQTDWQTIWQLAVNSHVEITWQTRLQTDGWKDNVQFLVWPVHRTFARQWPVLANRSKSAWKKWNNPSFPHLLM